MTNKTALLTPLSLATAATLAAILTPASAIALTFHWSFVAGPGSSGQVGQTISGTIFTPNTASVPEPSGIVGLVGLGLLGLGAKIKKKSA